MRFQALLRLGAAMQLGSTTVAAVAIIHGDPVIKCKDNDDPVINQPDVSVGHFTVGKPQNGNGIDVKSVTCDGLTLTSGLWLSADGDLTIYYVPAYIDHNKEWHCCGGATGWKTRRQHSGEQVAPLCVVHPHQELGRDADAARNRACNAPQQVSCDIIPFSLAPDTPTHSTRRTPSRSSNHSRHRESRLQLVSLPMLKRGIVASSMGRA